MIYIEKTMISYRSMLILCNANRWPAAGKRTELQYICRLFPNVLLKCRNDGELPMKNDDFALKNGHLFCNWRYADTASAMGGRVTDWREAASSIRTEGGEGSHSMLVVCAQAHSIIM